VTATNDIAERRAVVAALKMLAERGVLEQLDGDVEGYVRDNNPPVLLAIHHTRLLHVIANYSPERDPVADPAAWLDTIEREPEAPRRMRRRLVDDTLVHAADLDDAEADWLRRRLRGDDGGPLADAFGLHIERRTEGAAFVVPECAYRHPWELGPLPFPASGTVAHAALLICNWAATAGETPADVPAGWRSVSADAVGTKLAELAVQQRSGSGGWSRDLAADPTGRLRDDVAAFLSGLDLLRVCDERWLLSPAIARWPAPKPKKSPARIRASTAAQPALEFGEADDPDLA
jgi:uncharacterized protein (TIGR02678 family)